MTAATGREGLGMLLNFGAAFYVRKFAAQGES
jgi:hypothetical protein